jgi:CHAD domain-containing protein
MRDVHVHLIATGELLKDFPQLSGFVDDLAGREEKLKRAAARTMRNFRDRTLGRQSDRVVEGFVDRAARERDEATHARIARKVNKAHERVLRHRAGIDTEWPRSIHRMRVAFKKFRYTAEIAAPLFDQLTVERLDAMQAFQTRMGHIQDLDTLLGAMMTFRERYGQTSLLVPENEIRRKQRARVREFMSAADEARFFWGTAETSLDRTPGRAGEEAG